MSQPQIVATNPDGSPKVWFFTDLESLLKFDPLDPVPSLPPVVDSGEKRPSLPFVPTPPVAQLERGVDSDPAPQPVTRPSVAETLALVAKIKACPHWSKPSCSCQWGVCALGKGRGGQVSHDECRECLKSNL